MSKRRKDSPLNIAVDNGKLVISIGVSTLAYSFLINDENNPFVDKKNDFKRAYKITDEAEFAKEVISALYDEREDGSTILTDLLDKAMWNAIEDGAQGVEEDNRLHKDMTREELGY